MCVYLAPSACSLQRGVSGLGYLSVAVIRSINGVLLE